MSHRTSASIALNRSRERNIWQITCVNIQANRHIDVTSAQSHLHVRSTWRIMLEFTLVNHHIDVNFAKGHLPEKNIWIIIYDSILGIHRIVATYAPNHLQERYVKLIILFIRHHIQYYNYILFYHSYRSIWLIICVVILASVHLFALSVARVFHWKEISFSTCVHTTRVVTPNVHSVVIFVLKILCAKDI